MIRRLMIRRPIGQRTPLLATLTLLLLMALPALGADVWKVSSAKGNLFIGGTFHLLTPADYPLPAEYDIAYQAAQSIVLETDLERLRDPTFQRPLQQALQYPAGQNIVTALKPATIRQVKDYLATKQVPFDAIEMLRPGMLSITLTMIELRGLGLTGTGVDEYFFQRAKDDGKQIHWFESAEQQIDFLARMGAGHEDELIVYTLADMKNIPHMMTDMKAAWRKGDSAELEASSVQPYMDEFPELMHMLLDQRNDNWLPIIEQMIKSEGTEFILVGALHLVGDKGVLSQLRKHGYRVEKVSAPLPAPRKQSAATKQSAPIDQHANS